VTKSESEASAKLAHKRTPEEISEIMRRVQSSDTAPEARLRAALADCGLTSPDPTASATLSGKPDLVFAEARLAVFVDGDLWHGNQWWRRGLTSLEEQFRETPSKAYWLRKIRRNMQRDSAATAALLDDGWAVLRLWESQINVDLAGCVALIASALASTGKRQPPTATINERGAEYDVARVASSADEARARLARKTCAEFFAGIGLMRMGLERDGWSVAFANDYDERKAAIYRGHFGADDRFHLGDIHALSVTDIPNVTLATASFPCNDLSLAGARQGLAGKQSSAFWGFTRILTELGARKPPLILLENVVGFLTSHGGEDLTQALRTLNNLGYAMDMFQLDAAHFTPQSRQRLFLLGMRADLLTPAETDQTDVASFACDARPPAVLAAIGRRPDILWRLRRLPPLPTLAQRLPDILDDLPEDAPEWWSTARTQRLLDQMSPRHRALAERLMAGETWSYGTIFRRTRNGTPMAELRADGIAGCLRTPRGGSARQILFKAGYGQARARLLTGREAARLMGADDYTLPKTLSLNDVLFGFGDAVCVPATAWIATYYLNPLVNELLRGHVLQAPAMRV